MENKHANDRDHRPAFHVDKKLREAGQRAAQAFEQERKDLHKAINERLPK